MRIAIASGKGGAGKTSVTAQLARVWKRPHTVADMDLEAPNLHLFLKPTLLESTEVTLQVPVEVDRERCIACGLCRDICGYGAIARFGKTIKIFSDMCHGCGGCFDVCQEEALVRGTRALGTISRGMLPDGTPYFTGATRIGEVMTPPLIRALLRDIDRFAKKQADGDPDVLMDCPPGVSCPVMTVVTRADAVVMVVDPTPFGRHDFFLCHEAFSRTGKPLACVLNRSGMPGNDGDDIVRGFCRENDIQILMEIPFDREAAASLSRGVLPVDGSPALRDAFARTADRLAELDMEKSHA